MRRLVLCRLVSCLVFLFCANAHALSYSVSKVADTNDGTCNSDCSLREAVAAANADGADSTITFNPTVFAAPRKIIAVGSILNLNEDVIITGPAAGVTIEGVNLPDAIFNVKSLVNASLDGLTISKAVYGIFSAGQATVSDCTLSDNSEMGLYNNRGGSTLTNCTLSGNNFGILNSSGTADLVNCTLSGNRFFGLSNSSGTTTLTNCTVSGNSGGVKNAQTTNTVTLKNSIVAGNTTNTEGPIDYGVNNIAAGTAAEVGLETDGTGKALLKDNDGPTQTIALLPGSSAVDAASDASAPATDQRRYTRPQGAHSDIGAFELAPMVLVINDVTAKEGNSGTTNFVFTVKLLRPSANVVTVDYATADGTANAGSDYTAKSGTLTFPAGTYAASFTVLVSGNTTIEPYETFFVNLSNPINAPIADGQGVGTITTDDFETPSLVVNTTGDKLDNTDGVNSLREAIAFANSNPDGSTVEFAPALAGQTITLDSALPALTGDITITSPAAGITLDAVTQQSDIFYIFYVTADVTASFNSLTLRNGNVGIFNRGTANVTGSTLSDNDYAGISNGGTGTATLINCTLSSNSFSGLVNEDGATATVTKCTLSNNGIGINNIGTATVTNSTLSGSSDVGFFSSGPSTLTNCTISGGANIGFQQMNEPPATLTNCTISGNRVGVSGNYGLVTLNNCTVSGNTQTGFFNDGPAILNNSLVVGNGTNLSGSAPSGTNNITTGTAADAGLDPNGLQSNGGPTKTIALLPGSVAINAGDDAIAPANDQRGYARVGRSDKGAFEYGGSPPDTLAPTIAITSPANNAVVATLPSINGAASDNVGVTRVDLYLQRKSDNKFWNGSIWTTATAISTVLSGSNWSKTSGLPTGANLSSGAYFVAARAFDAAGNGTSATRNFTIAASDTTAPSIAIAAPTNNAAIMALPSISGTARDNAGVVRVGLYLQRKADNKWWNGSAWVAPATVLSTTLSGASPRQWTRNAGLPSGANLANGAYFVAARAFDAAGNGTSATANFFVDTIAPTIAIATPTNNSVVASLPLINGTAGDNATGVVRVDLYLQRKSDNKWWNGSAWVAPATVLSTTLSGASPRRWTRNASQPSGANLANGAYFVAARAFDAAGNGTSATTNFSVNRPAVIASELSPVALSSANAQADGTIRLTFTGELGASAGDAANYTVTLNEQTVEVASVQQPDASTVEIRVPTEGRADTPLTKGARVAVAYELQDEQGRAVSGTAIVTVK